MIQAHALDCDEAWRFGISCLALLNESPVSGEFLHALVEEKRVVESDPADVHAEHGRTAAQVRAWASTRARRQLKPVVVSNRERCDKKRRARRDAASHHVGHHRDREQRTWIEDEKAGRVGACGLQLTDVLKRSTGPDLT